MFFYTVEVDDTKFTIPRRYRRLKPIGCGSQGVVCSAYDTDLKQKVAIKKLYRPFDDELFAKRAYREFKLMRSVNHRNVIGLLNAFTPQTSLQTFKEMYLVTEHVNKTLDEVYFKELNHEIVSYLLHQILCGVRHLHAAGIIHRDLKPSNIVIKRDGSLKILDFGLARTADRDFMMTPYVVTRYYRAPEVILEMSYSESVDVWSIGCILAEMVLNRVLFVGRDYIDQWSTIIRIIGYPDTDFIRRLKPAVKKYVLSNPRYSGYTVEELFPDSLFSLHSKDEKKLTASEYRDLINHMLVIDPEKRISVDEALVHNYVKVWLDDREFNIPPPTVYDETIECEEYTEQEWKEIVYPELIDYQKNHNPKPADYDALPETYIKCDAEDEENLNSQEEGPREESQIENGPKEETQNKNDAEEQKTLNENDAEEEEIQNENDTEEETQNENDTEEETLNENDPKEKETLHEDDPEEEQSQNEYNPEEEQSQNEYDPEEEQSQNEYDPEEEQSQNEYDLEEEECQNQYDPEEEQSQFEYNPEEEESQYENDPEEESNVKYYSKEDENEETRSISATRTYNKFYRRYNVPIYENIPMYRDTSTQTELITRIDAVTSPLHPNRCK